MTIRPETWEMARELEAVVNQIRPLIGGRDPSMQGAILAQLTSIWLAGHHADLREQAFTLHVGLVRDLLKVDAEAADDVRKGVH